MTFLTLSGKSTLWPKEASANSSPPPFSMAFEDVYTHQATSTSNSDETGRSVNPQWGNIVTRTLGDLNLVFCGEVDGVKGQHTQLIQYPSVI